MTAAAPVFTPRVFLTTKHGRIEIHLNVGRTPSWTSSRAARSVTSSHVAAAADQHVQAAAMLPGLLPRRRLLLRLLHPLLRLFRRRHQVAHHGDGLGCARETECLARRRKRAVVAAHLERWLA